MQPPRCQLESTEDLLPFPQPTDEVMSLDFIIAEMAALLVQAPPEEQERFARVIEVAYNLRHADGANVEIFEGKVCVHTLLVPFGDRTAVYVDGRLARFAPTTAFPKHTPHTPGEWALREAMNAGRRRHGTDELCFSLEEVTDVPGYSSDRLEEFITGFKTPPETANVVYAYFYAARARDLSLTMDGVTVDMEKLANDPLLNDKHTLREMLEEKF